MKAPPKYVLNILCALDSAGHRAVLAGGCVRDNLLGRRPSDWDIASSASPEEVLALFPRCVPTGIKHGTVTVLSGGGSVEVTAFRAEGGYSDHRRPDSVSFGCPLEADLARRDLTVNAMAMDAAGEITDPSAGGTTSGAAFSAAWASRSAALTRTRSGAPHRPLFSPARL